MFRITFPGQAHIVSFLALLIMLISQACIWGPISLEEELVPISSGSEERLFEGSIAMVYQRDVYVLDPYGSPPKQLTDSPLEPKTKIALSHGKGKIAYLDQNAFPVLIDSSGQELAHLTEYGPILYLGWSGDDQTLWMMGEDRKEFQYYGPDMGLVDNPVSPYSYLNSLDVSSNGVVAFLSAGYLSIFTPNQGLGGNLSTFVSSSNKFIDLSHDGTKLLYRRSAQEPTVDRYSFTIFDIPSRQNRSYELQEGNLINLLLNDDGSELHYVTAQYGYNTSATYTNLRSTLLRSATGSGTPRLLQGDFLSILEEQSEEVYFDWKP